MVGFPLYVTGFSWKPSVLLVVVDYSRKPMAWPPHFEMPDGMEECTIPSSRINNASCCCDLCNKILSLESSGSGWYPFPAITGNSVLVWQTGICLLTYSPTRKSKNFDLPGSFLSLFSLRKSTGQIITTSLPVGHPIHGGLGPGNPPKNPWIFQVLELYGILGGGFQHFLFFTWGNGPIWAAYFSNGLKPLTIMAAVAVGSRCARSVAFWNPMAWSLKKPCRSRTWPDECLNSSISLKVVMDKNLQYLFLSLFFCILFLK